MQGYFASSFLRHGSQLRVGWLPYDSFDTEQTSLSRMIDRITADRPERFTELSELAERASDKPEKPMVFIFHVSHCGSTLLVNACNAVAGARVLSEPPILGPRQLLRRLRYPENNAPVDRELHGALIRGAVNSFAVGGPPANYVVVKLMNLASLFLMRFRSLFPDSPFIFVYRDPAVVVRKLLKSVEEHVRISRMPLIRYALGKPDEWDPPAGIVWSAIYEAECAAAMFTPRTALLNYTDLKPERVTGLLRAAEIDAGDIDDAALRAAFLRDSKDPHGREFQADRDGNSPQLADDIVASEEFVRAQAAYARIDAFSRLWQPA